MISYRRQAMDMKLMTRALEHLDLIHAMNQAIRMPEQKCASTNELLLILERKQFLQAGDLVELLQDSPKNFGLQFSNPIQPPVMPSNGLPSVFTID
ncbi:uncharacterized protein EAE97_007065 [Botrytis byssoidea]|uniref:Uncharacterized protein n=1 Tax=Botrytis byssoidea TaxID=139641 RepID=A0A9P5ILD3_9HELO|nr:uncharacterized protein EAE97_007065 [Botrytis byssoidea]KAF7940880.1 hypothetical protein EAE97_007065 [Botrytis byssoidea]